MKKVLILNPYFFPGYRSGGPQQTIKNVCDVYGDKCEIYLLTQNHDLNVETPYEGIETGKWLEWGNIKIKYLSHEDYGFRAFKSEYQQFDTIYTCGMFEKNTYQMLLVHRLAKRKKTLYVAPMGVFSEGALASKTLKKKIFFGVFKLLGLLECITWSFTSAMEYKDACKIVGAKRIGQNYLIAEDLPRKIDFETNKLKIKEYEKTQDRLKVVFLSRICVHKNLGQCIEILSAEYPGDIDFDVYGVLEDEEYWEKCKEQALVLPDNVHFRYCGEVKSERVTDVFSQYDVFLFPTKGENYGHVIFEALAVGCLPIISDLTPWQDLEEAGCGQVVSLQDIEQFRECLKQWIEAESVVVRSAKMKSVSYAQEKYKKAIEHSGYGRIFGCES